MPDSPEQIVTTYLERLAEIRSTGGATNETSYYSALERLLNDIGAALRPQVICNGQLRNQGAGHPDFGLYTRQHGGGILGVLIALGTMLVRGGAGKTEPRIRLCTTSG
jgi:hypothetical protein